MADQWDAFNPQPALSQGGDQWAAFNPQTKTQDQGPSIGDVALNAGMNFLPSVGRMVGGIYQSVRHPIDTIYNLTDTAVGGGEELSRASGLNSALGIDNGNTTSEDRFDALKNYYIGRYGSLKGFEEAVQKDPAGILSDASAVLGGTGAALKAIPGLETAANVASKASKLTNPINITTGLVTKPLQLAAKASTNIIGDLGTFTGPTALDLAYSAGQSGGKLAKAFTANQNGTAPIGDVVDAARDAVFKLKEQKNQEYQEGMAEIASQTAKQQQENKLAQMQYNARAEDTGVPGQENPAGILSFDPIDEAFTKNAGMQNFQGKDIGKSTADIREKISNEISDWKNSDAGAFHTPMGFDALKRSLYDIASEYPIGSPANLFGQRMARAVRQTIIDQAPQYATVMNNYETASNTIKEIESELSLGPKANFGTTLRKLQSVMRNNVQTNYTYRKGLTDTLAGAGQPQLPYQLAGQALNRWSPRGLGAAVASADIFGALTRGKWGYLAGLPLMSPRLMGNVYYGLGAANRVATQNQVLNRLAPYSPSLPGATNLLYQLQAPSNAQSYFAGVQ